MAASRHLPRLSGVVSLCLLLCTCAQEVGLIDRTQSGLLQKSLFEGEWFMRRTVIDVPYDIGYTFVGEQEEAVRIRWDIQKDLLVAYRVHPFIDNTPNTTPVAAFAIEDHVDVIREYNAATGEQTNVLTENSSDRLWFERESMRVDWSKNVVTNFNFYIDQLDLEPVAYFTEDRNDEDRVLIGVRDGETDTWTDYQDPDALKDIAEADYLDVVTRVFVKPESIFIEDWDGLVYEEPACWYYLNSDCAPAIITIRNSFLRVDSAVSSDYEPLEYPDNYVARDADHNPIRVRWNQDGDRERISGSAGTVPGRAGDQPGSGGPTDPYATGDDSSFVRVPMFDKFGYFRTERFGYDDDYGEIESSRIYLINRWNIWQRSRDDQGQPIPYAQRGTRKIVYYLSPDFPPSMRAMMQQVADQWDRAFRDTVMSLTGSDPGTIFELRDNTRQIDPETGAVIQRGEVNGDLRYSHIWYVATPLRVGILGYGPASIDPLTGEIFQADAYVYGAVAREVATEGRDVVDLLNGRLDESTIATGGNVTGAFFRQTQRSRQPPSREEISEFAREHRGAGPPARSAGPSHKRPPRYRTPADMARRPGIERIKRPAGWTDAKLSRVRDTALHELLMGDPELLLHFGRGRLSPTSPVSALSAADRARVNPVRWASPNHKRQQLDRFRSFSRRNMMMAAFVDDAVAGTALELADTPSDQIVDILAARIVKSTAEHEVGHTLGLRHNFEASTDALNFHPRYWELRGERPTPLAPMTEDEKNGKLRELQYSSIMDYHGRFNTDTQGLGPYDRAAIKFGYGGLVEVFAGTPMDPLLDVHDLGDGTYDRLFALDDVLRDFRHYTRIPSILGGVAAIGARSDVPWDGETAVLMGRSAGDSYLAQMTGDAPWSRWEVPYRFCSDEYVGGTATCHAFDLGVDSYEIVTDAIDRYRAYYWFNNFKRDRVFFDEFGYMDTMWWRYFSFVHLAHQNWVFDQWFDADTWAWLRDDAAAYGIEDVPWTEAIDGGGADTAAMMEGLTFLNEVLATPEPGAYWYDFDEGYYWAFSQDTLPICETEWSWESEDWCSDANFELGDGRYFNSIYDWESGYYFYERLRWVGTFYDKLLALETMTLPDTFFVGVAASESLDEYAISMYASFPGEIQKIFAGIAADRFDLFAGVIEEDGFTYLPPQPFARGAAAEPFELYAAVDPSTSFTIQLYALWYGMAFLNANYDNTFNDTAKIWLAGSGEAIDTVDPATTISFRDPFTQRIYTTTTRDEAGFFGVGQTMIERANQLLADYELVASDPDYDAETVDYYRWRVTSFTENIEVVRGLYELYGYLYF